MDIGSYDAGHSFQLASAANNNRLWFRRRNDNTFTSWDEIVTASALNGGIIDSRYVLKSGDTMTGNLITRTVYPSTDNSVTSGTTSNRWTNIYSFNGNFSNVVTTTWLTGITNTSRVSNFNADLLDGYHYSDIINGNVASATKLQTARAIWGQNFTGEQNVSGTLYGVGDIQSNYYSLRNTSNPYLYLSAGVS